MIATITSKGQVTLPVALRVKAQLDAGDKVDFVEVEPGKYLMIPRKQSVMRLCGMIPKPKKPVSIAQMNRAIAQMGRDADGKH